MKPAWDQLGSEFTDSKTVIIADVDCTVEKDLCSRFGVKGFPTIKAFKAGDQEGESYEGGRDYDSLKSFADENLGPSCSLDNMDLCDDAQKAKIAELQALETDVLKDQIAAAEAEIEKLESDFKETLEGLQATYKKAMATKDEGVAEAKKPLGMMKMVARGVK